MKIVLTHSQGRLTELAPALAARGHEVLHLPLIETQPRIDDRTRQAAAELLQLPWLLVTSRSVAEAFAALELPLAGARPRIGAVGAGTADALAALGARVSLLASPATAVGLARAFLAHPEAAGPVGLPQGNRARPDLQRTLTRAGFRVKRVVLYQTVTRPWPADRAGAADVVLLASPSAVRALPASVAEKAALIALGPSTAAAVRARGWTCRQAERPDETAVLAAILAAVERMVPS